MSTEQPKTHTTNRRKFKLVIYFTHRENGQPYSFIEIQRKMNRKYIESYDYTQGKENKNITNHRLALQKLLKTMESHKQHIKKAILIMNDWTNNKEITIGVFPNGDFAFGDFIEPIFTAPTINGHVYVDFLPRDPLRIDDMRVQNLQLVKDRKPQGRMNSLNNK